MESMEQVPRVESYQGNIYRMPYLRTFFKGVTLCNFPINPILIA
jgi:hypothetical protein